MDNFNDPIIQELAKAYLNILSESHTHEELVKLSDSELKELVDEYTKKAAEAEGEEKEHHEKELADIKSILASRKSEAGEVKEEAEQIDELSKDTLGAYIRLAAHDASAKTATHLVQNPGPVKDELGKDVVRRHKGIAQAVRKLTKEEAEDHLGAAHSALEDAGKHYNPVERGYEKEAVPHMKRAKAALAKARAAGHNTKEADARYKDIHDRIDAPHRKELEEEKLSAKEIVQNISEWMKSMKEKKNAK